VIFKYWCEERVYHHTGSISLIYALREALRIIYEEGIEKRWARHRRNSNAFIVGIESMGLEMYVQENCRLPSLNTVSIPMGVSDINIRRILLDYFNTEIGGGLGVLKGKIWRVGLMEMNSMEKNVIMVLEALERALKMEGYAIKSGGGVGPAIDFYDST